MLKNLTNEDYIIIGKMWEKKSGLSEYRVILALNLKRPLEKNEIVHHINKDNKDNRIENLLLCSSINEHSLYHRKKNKSPVKINKIKFLREKKDMTQQELADSIGINRTLLSWIETESLLPTKDLLSKIARILNCLEIDLYRKDDLESMKK